MTTRSPYSRVLDKLTTRTGADVRRACKEALSEAISEARKTPEKHNDSPQESTTTL